MENLSSNFDALRNLHDCANDLLRSPVTQQALVHYRHEKWVDEVCEGSLRLLDVCGITRDVLLLVKGHLQDIQSALRRRCVGQSGTEMRRIKSFDFSIKKMRKDMFKCLEALKGMEERCDPLSISDVDHNIVLVVLVVREMRITTISIVEAILSFLSLSKPKLKPRRRSFILNCVGGKRVANAPPEENYESSEMKMARSLSTEGVETASKHFKALEVAIEGFEVELECMFRRLIQSRVSLLNILNN